MCSISFSFLDQIATIDLKQKKNYPYRTYLRNIILFEEKNNHGYSFFIGIFIFLKFFFS